jgi:hypothetical protein
VIGLLFVLALSQDPGADFVNDVLPHLTRLGCNAGTCHGSAPGQKGFKLSLLGYDPAFDYVALTRELRGRRIDLADPGESLLLKKPTRKVKHGGGRLMTEESEAYRTIAAWIRAGAPYRSGTPVDLVRIEAKPGEVTAHYSDGSKRDVTRLALLSANDDSIADPDGTVKASGETSIMVRYGGQVAAVKVGKPYGPRTEVPWRKNAVDDWVNGKIAEFGLRAAPPCDDATFLRRATLDAHGRLPTPEEVKSFDGNRDELVDRLLARPEFEAYWGYLLVRMLGAKAPGYQAWLRGRVGEPYDETVVQLLSKVPWLYLERNDPKMLSEFVGQTFLGARWACAQCHNHPFERFSQRNYYEMASFFARVRVREGRVELEERGELELEGKPVLPPFRMSADRREDLARWATKNDAFARATANRVWAILMGRGLVEPVDDLRVSNPATHPELLEALAAEFRKDFSIRGLVGFVMKSAAYARRTGAGDAFYSTRGPKGLDAEVLADAIVQATGGGEPRAIDQPSNPHPLLKGETLARTLHLMNGAWLNGRLKPDSVENLYLRTLSRFPTAEERAHWSGDDAEYRKDLLWALLNSKEFGSNH